MARAKILQLHYNSSTFTDSSDRAFSSLEFVHSSMVPALAPQVVEFVALMTELCDVKDANTIHINDGMKLG